MISCFGRGEGGHGDEVLHLWLLFAAIGVVQFFSAFHGTERPCWMTRARPFGVYYIGSEKHRTVLDQDRSTVVLIGVFKIVMSEEYT